VSAYRHFHTADSLPEAGLLEDWLRQHGVPVRLQNQFLSGAIGELPPHLCAPQLWVREDQLGHAEALLKQWRQSDAENDQPWICQHCGAAGERGFLACWRCQHAREESP
jgi:hypothetical protein